MMVSSCRWLRGSMIAFAFCTAWAQTLTIVDPIRNALVSGPYEVVLEKEGDEEVFLTEILVDGAVRFSESGWHELVTINFDEAFKRVEVQAQIKLVSGVVVRSNLVITKELAVYFEETTRLVLLSAIVRSRFNRPVEKLSKDDFRVFESNQPLEIATFDHEEVPLDLVLMMDTSSSLRGAMDTLRGATTSFLEQLHERDRVALVSFSSKVDFVMDFTNDRKTMRKSIQAFEAYGETALFDTLLKSLEKVGQRDRGRRAIVLFTDGRDSVHEEPNKKARLFRKAISRAQNNEILIFTIGLGKRINEDALQAMAEETGGRYYHADGLGDLADRFDQVLSDLRNQYLLGVVPATSRRGFHPLEIKVKKMGTRVFARKGYTLD